MARGRSRDLTKESFWRKLVQAHARSGLSVGAFCRKRGQRASAFYRWRAQLARRDGEPGCGGMFVPVRVTEDVEDSPRNEGRIEIALSGGRHVRVQGQVSRQMLADVLAVVEGRSC